MGVEASKPEDTANEDAIKEKRQSISKNDDLVRKHVRPQVCYPMKIIIRGSRGSGKSSLFKRLKGEPLNLDTELSPEIQIASINWELKTADDHSKIDIWDVVDDGYLLESTSSTSGDAVDGNTGSNAVRIGKHRYQPLDAKAVDVYKDTQAVIFVINPFAQLSLDYVKHLYQQIPLNICIVLLLNFKDITSTTDRRIAVTKADVIKLAEEIRKHRNQSQHWNISSSSSISINSSDRDSSLSSATLGSTNMMLKESESIFVLEVSMLNCFGLTELYKYLEIPFLFTKKRLLTQQLERVNADLFKTNDKLKRNIAVINTEECYLAFTRKLESRRNGTNQSALPTTGAVAAVASINSHSEKSTTTTVQKVDTDKAVAAVPSSSSQSVSSSSQPKLPLMKRSESRVDTPTEKPTSAEIINKINTDNNNTDRKVIVNEVSKDHTTSNNNNQNQTKSTSSSISTQSVSVSTGFNHSNINATTASVPPPVNAITKNDMSTAEYDNNQQQQEPEPTRPARSLKKLKRAPITTYFNQNPVVIENAIAANTSTTTVNTNTIEEHNSTANPPVIISAESTDDIVADRSVPTRLNNDIANNVEVANNVEDKIVLNHESCNSSSSSNSNSNINDSAGKVDSVVSLDHSDLDSSNMNVQLCNSIGTFDEPAVDTEVYSDYDNKDDHIDDDDEEEMNNENRVVDLPVGAISFTTAVVLSSETAESFSSSSSSSIIPSVIPTLNQETSVTAVLSTTEVHLSTSDAVDAHINTTIVIDVAATADSEDNDESDGNDNINNNSNDYNIRQDNNDDNSDNNSNNNDSKNTFDIKHNLDNVTLTAESNHNSTCNNYESQQQQQQQQQQQDRLNVSVDNDSNQLQSSLNQTQGFKSDEVESQDKVDIISASTGIAAVTANEDDIKLRDVIRSNKVDSCNDIKQNIEIIKPSVDNDGNVNNSITVESETTTATTTTATPVQPVVSLSSHALPQPPQPVKKPQKQFSNAVRKGRRSKHQNNNDSDDSSSDSDNKRETDSKNNIKVNMRNAVNTTSKQSLLEVETERVMAAVVSSAVHDRSNGKGVNNSNSIDGGGVIDDSFFEINDDDDKDNEEVKDDNQTRISNSSTVISTGVNNHRGIRDDEETNDRKLDISKGHSDAATNKKIISTTSSFSSSSSSTYTKPRRITKASLHKQQPVSTTISSTLIPTTLDNSNGTLHNTANLDSITTAAALKSNITPITSSTFSTSTTTPAATKPDLSTAAKQALAAAMMYAQQQLDKPSSSLTIAEEEGEGVELINDEENHQQSKDMNESDDDDGEDSDNKDDISHISNVVVTQIPTKISTSSSPSVTPSLSSSSAVVTNTHHSIRNNATHAKSSNSSGNNKEDHIQPAVPSTKHHSIRNNGQSMMSNAVNNSNNNINNNNMNSYSYSNKSTSSLSSPRMMTSSMKNHNMNDDDDDDDDEADVYSNAGLHSTKNNKDMIFNNSNNSSSSSPGTTGSTFKLSVSSAAPIASVPSSMKERNLHSNITTTTTAVPTSNDSNHVNSNDNDDDNDNDSKAAAPVVKRSSGLKRVTKKKVPVSVAL